MMVNNLWTVCLMICVSLSISVDADEGGFCIKNITVQKIVRKSKVVKKGWFNRKVTEYYNELNINVPEQVKDCCEGFVKNGSYCDPHCDDTCENGKCIGNNECECFTGFKKISSHNCIPECSNCDNGKCFAPQICDCNHGYRKSDEGKCVPQCNNPCDNGNCIGPEKCECYDGYTKSDKGTCVPQCNPPCVNAECIAPNKCQCFEKYRFINDTACALEFLQKYNACVDKCFNGLFAYSKIV